jgi:hypothetical protein
MRRIIRATTAASILTAVLATGTFADTSEPTEPYDTFSASAFGSWTDPADSSTYDIGIEITHDLLGGASTALFAFSSFDPTYVCDVGDPADPDDDTTGRDFEVQATATTGVVLTIADRLASATASATVTGQEVWRDECGGVQTGATRTFDVSLSTKATGAIDRSRGRTVEVLADGTKLVRTYGGQSRASAGSFAVDAAASDATGSIYQQTMTIRTH